MDSIKLNYYFSLIAPIQLTPTVNSHAWLARSQFSSVPSGWRFRVVKMFLNSVAFIHSCSGFSVYNVNTCCGKLHAKRAKERAF